ncbi:MAG: glycosyltransferase family 39 protein [Saprospiraceae bacterium]|nr:glycosyltransferase family 39 protein [Saprospiraceae bacterium]
MFSNWKRFFGFGIGIWLLLNIIQAAFLPLDPDEAYYWMYAQQLDWGYFDHPPMVALLIKLGSSCLGGPLGVRLGSILIFAATLYGLWVLVGKPTERKPLLEFLLLASAMPILQLYGFVATPDSPLLLFTVLFFLTYKSFLEKDSWANTIALGLIMALLLYSKYHGVLIIFFTVLSNLRLLTNPKFYLAGILGASLYFPHLYWQYMHDFPTFRYHLGGRNDTYELKYTFNYLLNQLLIFSPLLLPFIIKVFRKKPQDTLERTFFFVCFGFWAFFFYSTFKGHVEPQWTAILCIPFVVLLYKRHVASGVNNRRFQLMIRLTLGLLIIIRLGLLFPIPGLQLPFHQVDWVADLQEEVGDRPVVFIDSYRNPSIYTFYSGQQAYTYTDILYRLNQYDIWDREKEIQGQDILLVGPKDWEPKKAQIWRSGRKDFRLSERTNYQVTQKLEIQYAETKVSWTAGDSLSLPIRLYNPYPHALDFEGGTQAMEFLLQFDLPTEHLEQVPLELEPALQSIGPGEKLNLTAHFRVPNLKEKELLVSFCLKNGDLRAAYLSPKFQVKLK